MSAPGIHARRSSKDFKLRSLEQCVRYPIIKDLKYFELLRYGSYKRFMTQSRKSDKIF